MIKETMSNSSDDVKLYTNADRSKPIAYKKYVPQYQLLGIEPEEVRSAVVPNTILAKANPLPLTNPRSSHAPVRQPYARVIPSPIKKDPVPNVGNNMEHTWSSVDGELIDDLSIDIDHPMIDNNDFVSPEPQEVFSKFQDKPETLPQVKEDEYLLLIDGTVIATGSLEEIQEYTKDFVFGDHPLCVGNPVAADKLTVFKRVKIKIGVFLE